MKREYLVVLSVILVTLTTLGCNQTESVAIDSTNDIPTATIQNAKPPTETPSEVTGTEQENSVDVTPTSIPMDTSEDFEDCNVTIWVEKKESLWFIPPENGEFLEAEEVVNINIEQTKIDADAVEVTINGTAETTSIGTIITLFVFPYDDMSDVSTSKEMLTSYALFYSTITRGYVSPDFQGALYFANIVYISKDGSVLPLIFANQDYCYTNKLKFGGEKCQIDIHPDGSLIGWGIDKSENIICPLTTSEVFY